MTNHSVKASMTGTSEQINSTERGKYSQYSRRRALSDLKVLNLYSSNSKSFKLTLIASFIFCIPHAVLYL